MQKKQTLLEQTDEMVDGIILLDKPDIVGWTLFFDRADFEGGVEGGFYGRDQVRRFVLMFPRDPLARMFKAFWRYMGLTLVDPKTKNKEEEEEEGEDVFAVEEEDDLVNVLVVSPSLSLHLSFILFIFE